MANTKLKNLGGANRQTSDYNIAPPVFKDDYEEFKALLYNAFKIEGLSYDAEQAFKNLIIENNRAGYIPQGGIVGQASPEATLLDIYGNARFIRFNFPNLETFKRINLRVPADRTYAGTYGAYLIEGLPAGISYAEIIKKSVEIMRLCDIVTWQNLNAVKTAKVITVNDTDTLLSVKHAIQKIQAGAPVIEVSKTLAEALKTIDVSAPFIADKIAEFKRQIKDELLIRIGTLSANITKRERVQATEVMATVGQCEDYIYTLLDNLNNQFKEFGLPLKAVLNNSLEELYTGAKNEADSPKLEGEPNND